MTMNSAFLFRYWGKSLPKSEADIQWHPLVYHSLDVAAVGKHYLQRHDALRQSLARRLQVEENTCVNWLTFFLAIHDLGKFAEGFQYLNQTLFETLQGPKQGAPRPYSVRHDSLGFLLWQDCIRLQFEQDDWLCLGADQRSWRLLHQGFDYWARAVTGHHGQPPKQLQDATIRQYFTDTDQQIALAFCQQLRTLLLPGAAPQFLNAKAFRKESKALSWWLAGIAVLADWVGSNTDYFGYRSADLNDSAFEHYWQYAQQQAAKALADVGVLPSTPALPKPFSELFSAIKAPTPLQQKVAQLPLRQKPQLFILEDVTGAGKTEAAMMLLHRLISARLAFGGYIGLPTMATANAMYRRTANVYRSLFTEQSTPSLVLAHGGQHLEKNFHQSILAPVTRLDADYDNNEQTASARCSAWLADSRKRALLAEIGVGTIDQALQAILHSKHQSLRLLGLFGKVLLVDEVHACDAYMYKLLQTLLQFHASMGGSVILLSATLPQSMRQGLVAEFCNGCTAPVPVLTVDDYPLLTHFNGEDCSEQKLATRTEVERSVAVQWFDDLNDVQHMIAESAESGRCLCWIRNTVADAREAYALCVDLLGTERVTLFHARFAMHDRLQIEHAVVNRFGQYSTAEMRAGQVVIATQVIEQSLDLDFDLMISDLAPIDLLIQRAGRLCRHTRDQQGNRIDGTDQRGMPRLTVYGPKPESEPAENWFAECLPKAAWVYPNHGQLWLTAKLLYDQDSFHMPNDARALIEGVYGEDAELNIPPGLQGIHYNDVGKDGGERSQAQLNSVKLKSGYAAENDIDWWNDAVTPTRLGEASSTVRLARWDGEQLKPWVAGEFAWDLSQLQVRQTQVKSTAEFVELELQQAIAGLFEKNPEQAKWIVILPLTEGDDGFWTGQVVDGHDVQQNVYYSILQGFILEKELQALTQQS